MCQLTGAGQRFSSCEDVHDGFLAIPIEKKNNLYNALVSSFRFYVALTN